MALRLDVQIGGDATGFNRTLGSIRNMIAGAFTVGAVAQLARKTMEYADNVGEMSSRLGVGTDALQEWIYAAKQAGADAEKLTTFIERLTDAASDLKNLEGFQKYGINPEGMTPEQLFGAVSGQTRGKSATEISAMLKDMGLSIKQIGQIGRAHV